MIPRGNRPGRAPTTEEHSQELDPFCCGLGVPGLEKADPAKNSHPFHRQQKVLPEHRGNYSVCWSQSIGLHSGCGYRARVMDKPETAASRIPTRSIPLQLAGVCPSRPGSKFTSEQQWPGTKAQRGLDGVRVGSRGQVLCLHRQRKKAD